MTSTRLFEHRVLLKYDGMSTHLKQKRCVETWAFRGWVVQMMSEAIAPFSR